MKRLYDFIFCPGTLRPDIVFYTLTAGKSERDRRALAWLQTFVSHNTDFFLSLHTAASAEFIYNCKKSLFPGYCDTMCPARTAIISISQIVSFLKKYPAQLLNSANETCPR